MESTRVDRWLWAVRLTKTRSDAAAACRGGHVGVNNRPAKTATAVAAGAGVRVSEKRAGAPMAVECFVARAPKPPPEVVVPVAKRDRGAGRPTKRDRRV